MIRINLLPEEFRVVDKGSATQVPYVKLAIAGAGIFLLITLWLFVDFLGSSSRLKKLNADWKVVEPQAIVLNQLQTEVDNLKTEHDFMASFVATDKPLTYLLTWISEELPETCWLIETKLENKPDGSVFVTKGLCVPSKEMSSIEYIEDYLHKLKQKITDANLSLTTSRVIKEQVEVTRFVAIFEWKAVE